METVYSQIDCNKANISEYRQGHHDKIHTSLQGSQHDTYLDRVWFNTIRYNNDI